ncbi:hypothetical protein OG535_05520 [Kitasatospora sp. NBC_00085]
MEIRQVAVPGHAAQALLEWSRGADLLVVGSRVTADAPVHCWAR